LTGNSLDIPILETARLRLRGHRREDFEPMVATWTAPEVTRFLGGGKPFSREDIWGRMLRQVGHWALQGYGLWVVEEKDSREFVGGIGFFDSKRDMAPSLDGMPEMGWVLAPQMHGKGYATEAIRAAIAWGDVHFGKTKMCCIIAPENYASIRVAEKSGFCRQQKTTYKGEPTIIFVRDAI
jgi:RimJ/RimL family protein N-acetyltransferase